MTVDVRVGDALTVLRTLPDQSVQMCCTSPPYLGLRDYGVVGQLGLERTPEAYVAAMVGVFSEVKRVLRGDGTLWLNIGDSYAGSGKGGNPEDSPHKKQRTNRGSVALSEYPVGATARTAAVTNVTRKTFDGIKAKDLMGMPWMLAFALRENGWYLRSDIIWHKPNPMPESVTDRPTKSHEYLFLLTKSPTYYYDAEAILEPVSANTNMRVSQNVAAQIGSERANGDRPSEALHQEHAQAWRRCAGESGRARHGTHRIRADGRAGVAGLCRNHRNRYGTSVSRSVSIRDIDPSKLGPNSPLLALMKRKPRRDLEHQAQVEVFQWAAEHEAEHPELRWLFAVPNWIGRRTAKHGARLKAEGRKPGVPDIFLPVRRGAFVGLVLEMKAGNNRPTPEQRKWLNHLSADGWCVLVAWSSKAAIQWIADYLRGVQLPSWVA